MLRHVPHVHVLQNQAHPLRLEVAVSGLTVIFVFWGVLGSMVWGFGAALSPGSGSGSGSPGDRDECMRGTLNY